LVSSFFYLLQRRGAKPLFFDEGTAKHFVEMAKTWFSHQDIFVKDE